MKIKAALLTLGLLLFTTGAGIKETSTDIVDYAKENNYDFVYYEEDDSEYYDTDSYVLVYLNDGIAEYYDFANEDEANRFKEDIQSQFVDEGFTEDENNIYYNSENKAYINVNSDKDKVLYVYTTSFNELENTISSLSK